MSAYKKVVCGMAALGLVAGGSSASAMTAPAPVVAASASTTLSCGVSASYAATMMLACPSGWTEVTQEICVNLGFVKYCRTETKCVPPSTDDTPGLPAA